MTLVSSSSLSTSLFFSFSLFLTILSLENIIIMKKFYNVSLFITS